MYGKKSLSFFTARNIFYSTVSKSKEKPEKTFNFGLQKVERKHLRRRLDNAQSTLASKHIYKESFKIDDKKKLFSQLINSEIYNEKGLIALVKPFGVSRRKKDIENEKPTITHTLNSSGYVSAFSIEEVIPLLKKHYNAVNLEVILAPERWSSGILLLSLTDNVKERFQKCVRRSLAMQKPTLTFWAVAHGLTIPEAAGERVGVYHHYVQNIGKVPFIKRNFSKNEVEKQIVKPNIVEHFVLAHHKENDVSLVQVKVIHAKSHFIRVWLANCYSPVLGDRIFGGRVKSVLGKRILLGPNNTYSYQPPEISENLLKRLKLSIPQMEIIPPHVHLSEVNLHQFLMGKEDLSLTAPPPEYFLWTCKQLGLMAYDDTVIERDCKGIEDYTGIDEDSEGIEEVDENV